MSSLSASQLLLLNLLHSTKGYHLTLSILEWKNASQHCQSYCNSHLASFHSVSDYYDSIHELQRNKYVYKDVWIGLNDMAFEDVWQWSDGSPFDFGGNLEASGKIIRSQFPWRQGEPDPLSPDDAVAIEITRNLEWSDREQFGNYHFFCGSCDGKLEKYVAINGYKTRSDANTFCADTFGTSLASIHSARDMLEAQTACLGVTNSRGCWVGLSDEVVSREYRWDDGTDWTFGTAFSEYPWYSNQPGAVDDQKCIQIDPPEYLFNDDECNSTARTICNAPSEICDSSRWKNAEGDMSSWSFSTKPCRLTSSLRGASSNIFIGDREWDNGAEAVTAELQFAVRSVGDVGASVGMVFYHDATRCDSYYYIGLWPEYGYVFIGKFVNGEWSNFQYAELSRFGVTFKYNAYYTMSVALSGQSAWTVSMDGITMMTVSDRTPSTTPSVSGKIGVRNVNATMEAASLFVSGSVVLTDDNTLYLECNDLTTSSPTADPSESPTPSPTGHPTPAPTPRPSFVPTPMPIKPTRSLPPTLPPSPSPIATATRDEAGGSNNPPPTAGGGGGDIITPTTPSPVRPTVANNPNTPNQGTPFPSPSVPAVNPQAPSWTAKPTTTSPTAGSGGGGIPPNTNNDFVTPQEAEGAIPATAISEETMVWLIGIPAGAIMICLVASCIVNLYFCKKEFIEPEDEEGDYDDRYGDVDGYEDGMGYGHYDDDMIYHDEDSSVTEDRLDVVLHDDEVHDLHQYPKSF